MAMLRRRRCAFRYLMSFLIASSNAHFNSFLIDTALFNKVSTDRDRAVHEVITSAV